MNCPHCDHDFKLPWKKYFKSASEPHVCPGCGKKFRIIVTASSVLLLIAATIIAASMPAVIAFFLVHSFWWTIATYLLFLVVLVLPFDRWLDNKVRPVKPVP